MSLNNDDLYKKHDRLIQLKRETYEKLHKRCVNNIKSASNAGELVYLFEIPPFLFGSSFPIINLQSCANYIMNKLTSGNKHIKTAFIEPNFIFIDWRREEDMDYASADIKSDHRSTNSSARRSDRNRR